jgi:16S rRNA (guanine966-N2)-methyltransferase
MNSYSRLQASWPTFAADRAHCRRRGVGVIKAPPDEGGRREREAWMSILQNELPGARVVDLFAGSGALGLEALSRGAASVDLVEQSAESVATLRANVASLEAGDAARIVRADAMRFVQHLGAAAYDVAFADPPPA